MSNQYLRNIGSVMVWANIIRQIVPKDVRELNAQLRMFMYGTESDLDKLMKGGEACQKEAILTRYKLIPKFTELELKPMELSDQRVGGTVVASISLNCSPFANMVKANPESSQTLVQDPTAWERSSLWPFLKQDRYHTLVTKLEILQ